jgi:hypothetical protein
VRAGCLGLWSLKAAGGGGCGINGRGESAESVESAEFFRRREFADVREPGLALPPQGPQLSSAGFLLVVESTLGTPTPSSGWLLVLNTGLLLGSR